MATVKLKDMKLSDIQAEISELEKKAAEHDDVDDVFPEDAIRLDELRKEEKNRTRTKLSMAPRTGKINEITITPSEQLLSHAPSTTVAIANMDADKFPAAQTWADKYLHELRNPSTELRNKQKDLLAKQYDLNIKHERLKAVNQYIIDNFLNKSRGSILAFIEKPENVEHIREKFAERADLMAELGYADDRYDSITKNNAYKKNFDAIQKGLIAELSYPAGGKSKSKSKKRKRKRKSKKRKTRKHY